MRLGYLARSRGDSKRALEYIDQAKNACKKNPKAPLPTKLYCMRGKLLVELGRDKEAFAEFEKAKVLSQGRDQYARVGIANLFYAASANQRSNVMQQEENLRQSMQ